MTVTSIAALFVPSALRGAWMHNIVLHRASMIGVYIGRILIAGSLTLLPGRTCTPSCSAAAAYCAVFKAAAMSLAFALLKAMQRSI